MLSNKSIYRIVSLFAIISLLAVDAIAIDSKQSGFFPALCNNVKETLELQSPESVISGETETVPVNTQNRAENRMFAGGLDPNMLKELEKAESMKNKTDKPAEKKKGEPVNTTSPVAGKAPPVKNGVAVTNTEEAEVSTITLASDKHDEYLRVVLEGPHEIISAGEVRHKANVVSVTFSDANFSLEEHKLAVPFRREQNKVLFTQNNLEKIRTHNLLHPSRLAIDFYTKKVVAVEKSQPVSQNMEEQKQKILADTSIPAVEVQAPVSLMMPNVAGGDNNYDSEEEVKQAEAEEFQTISKKEDQKTVDKNLAEPVEKAVPQVTETALTELMVSNMPEVKGLPEKAVEKLLDTSSNLEKTSSVTESNIIKELDHREMEPDTEAGYVKEQSNSEPEPKFPPVVAVNPPVESLITLAPDVSVSTGQSPEKKESETVETVKNEIVSESSFNNSAPVMVTDVKKETVPVEMNDVKDNVDVQSVREVTAIDVQTEEVKRKIALLPFDNFSNNNDALDTVMPLLMVQLESMGHDVLGYEEVDAYLCERRIRQSSFISREIATELGSDKMVNTVMAGAVLTFSSGENPKIGILARLLDIMTGNIIWSDFVSLTGEDFTKVLGLGTIKSIDLLLPRALDRLFVNFENTTPNLSSNNKYKIAVLPFKNESEHRHAGMIITHLFQNELANNPMFVPVDFGDIRQNIINLRIGRKGEIDYNNLQALSKSLGVDVVLTGTVEEYRSGQAYSSPPSVTISARLLDSRRNRILWYDNLQLDGEENIIALDWGRLRSADKVAYGAVSGLVDNIKTEGLRQ